MASELFGPQNIRFDEYDTTVGAYLYQITPAPFSLVAGQNYIIEWDGESFPCMAASYDSLAPGAVILQHESCPVAAVYMESTDYAGFLSSVSGEHNVAVCQDSVEFEVLTGQWVWNSQFGKYVATIPKTFTLTEGEYYRIEVGSAGYKASMAYNITEMLGTEMVAVGATEILGLPGNDCNYVLGDGGTFNMVLCTYLEEGNPPGNHRFIISSAEAPSAGIVQYDRSGNRMEFYGKDILRVDTTDGGTMDFIHADLVEKTVELDFSGGDMSIEAKAGELFSKIIIPQPENLIEGNIKDGEVVAGLVGALVGGGGSNIVFKSGTMTGKGSSIITLTHELGEQPDIFFIKSNGETTDSSKIKMAFGFSEKFIAKIGTTGLSQAYTRMSNALFNNVANTYIEGTDTTQILNKANASTIVIGNSSYKLAIVKYSWFAIGGLT